MLLNPESLLRLWETIRPLRREQITNRIRRRLSRPRPDVRAAPSLAQAPAQQWRGCERAASMIAPDTFRFIGRTASLEEAGGWQTTTLPRLWRYNLHYFDDLTASDAERRREWHRALISRWLADNPPTAGDGWDPYPTSLRIVNWIGWHWAGNSLEPRALHSLAVQIRWLVTRLEYHLLGNHLWVNVKALVFAGAFFAGDEADRWLRLGTRLVLRELDEQILPDGGHFELSPMYHSLILQDVLDLLQVAALRPGRLDPALIDRLDRTAVVMLDWLRVMTHPDGQIALFNDSAFGIAPTPAALAAYAARVRAVAIDATAVGSRYLRDSGYVRLVAGDAVAIVDVGEIGPSYLPGHAHADTLGFELSVGKTRVLVDTGTGTYDRGAEREWQRGTAAHNTVSVGQRNSSDVWASFRVGRRARVREVEVELVSTPLLVSASHDGYRRAGTGVTHRRQWSLTPGELRIVDTLIGGPAKACAHWLMGPELTHRRSDVQTICFARTGDIDVSIHFEGANPAMATSQWHAEFGNSRHTQQVVVPFDNGKLSTRICWVSRQ